MNQELRHEYLKTIKVKDDNLVILQEKYRDEKKTVSLNAISDVNSDFKTLVEKVEKMGVEAIDRGMPLQLKNAMKTSSRGP